ncbi:MAG: hypothetical protein CMM93_08660 [Rickettsiales bacterium]|nr:hypothetical protein [Rickettsiales bacterium]
MANEVYIGARTLSDLYLGLDIDAAYVGSRDFVATVAGPTILRPIADVAIQSNTTGSYADIDEAVPDNSDFFACTRTNFNYNIFQLTSTADPNDSTNHKLRYTAVVSGGSGSIVPRLYEGGTVIWEGASQSIATTDTEYEVTIPTGDIDSITDYTDLRLGFRCSYMGFGGSVRIIQAEFEIP